MVVTRMGVWEWVGEPLGEEDPGPGACAHTHSREAEEEAQAWPWQLQNSRALQEASVWG